MSVLAVRVVQRHFYNTFQERGVLLPFTTPRLVGTRIRRGRTTEPELMLPNPGGAGFYIMTWPNMRNVSRPTVHDMQLYSILAGQAALNPGAVRRACRTTALRGLAGRAAAAAATAAEELDRAEARQTAIYLLVRLVEQSEQSAPKLPLADDSPPNVSRREDAAILASAARLSQPPQRIRLAIDQLSEMFSHVRGGHPASAGRQTRGPGRVMQLIDAVERISNDIGAWGALSHEASNQIARELHNAAQAVTVCGRAVLSEVAKHLDNPMELLSKLFSAPDQLAQFAERPDWTVNGWEQIAVRWQLGSDDWRGFDKLKELLRLIPPMPKQVSDWSRLRIDFDILRLPADSSSPADRAEPLSHSLILIHRLETLQAALLAPPVTTPAPARVAQA